MIAITLLVMASAALTFVFQTRLPAKQGQVVLASFVFHVVACLANAYMITDIYGRGDPLAFVAQGASLAEYILLAPSTYLPEVLKMLLQLEYEIPGGVRGGKASTQSMVAAAALAQLLVGSSFHAIHMVFAMLSFFGKIGIYQAFRALLPREHHLLAASATLLIPSVVFWSAGIIKEAMVIIMLGVAGFGVRSLARRRSLAGLALLATGLYGIALIKAYTLLCIIAATSSYLGWRRSVARGRVELRPLSLLALALVGLAGFTVVGMIFPKYSLANLGAEMASAQAHGHRWNFGSAYRIGNPDDTSLLGQLRYAPLGLFTGWYRPGIWEASNPQMVINGLETAFFLFLTLRGLRGGYKAVMDRFVAYPPLVFCAVFALTMGTATGLTSSNLGTLSRYRMPLLPFLVVWLLILNRPLPRRAHARSQSRVRTPPSRLPASATHAG